MLWSERKEGIFSAAALNACVAFVMRISLFVLFTHSSSPLPCRWTLPSRCGRVSRRELWDILPAVTSGTIIRSAGVTPLNGPMTIPWFSLELPFTTGTLRSEQGWNFSLREICFFYISAAWRWAIQQFGVCRIFFIALNLSDKPPVSPFPQKSSY